MLVIVLDLGREQRDGQGTVVLYKLKLTLSHIFEVSAYFVYA